MTAAAIFAGLIVAGLALFSWLGWQARKDKDRADAADQRLHAIRAAENAEAGVAGATPDAQREQLRDKWTRPV